MGLLVYRNCDFCTKCSSKAIAQSNIVPDDTLNAENSRVIPNIGGLPIEVITGGAIRGQNLFHSFQEFNVGEGRGAYFFSPSSDIQNILARVTGSDRSSIQGLLGTFGESQPNLLLINPNGIVFGKNARLDVGGSFLATTATSLNFADGTSFKATAPQTTPLLSISVPVGLQFGQNPERILVQGTGHNLTYSDTSSTIWTDSSGLQVQPGKTLALVGGDVVLEGGNLKAESGRIELGSIASPSLVSFTQTNSGFAVGYSGVQNFGEIQLSKKASADVSGEGGGEIQVQGRRVSLRDGSSILSITSGSKSGGSLSVNALELVELIGESVDGQYASSIFTEAQGTGAAGDLKMTAGKLNATEGAYISSYTYSRGRGGNISIQVDDSVELVGTGLLYSSGLYDGSASTGNAGNLRVTAGRLSLRDGAIVTTSTSGKGNAGDLIIETRQLSIRNSARVSTSTSNEGNAGNLFIQATDSVDVVGTNTFGTPSFLRSDVVSAKATGRGGNLTIETKYLSVKDGAQVGIGTFGRGNGGNLVIRASELVELIGAVPSGVASGLLATSQGNGSAGNVTITTGRLIVQDGAAVSSVTSGGGKGGNLVVNALDSVEVIGEVSDLRFPSGLATDTKGDGSAGNLSINTKNLIVRNGGVITSRTFGFGHGGTLAVTALESLEVIGKSVNGFPSGLSVETQGTGDAGDLIIEAGQLGLMDKALLTSRSEGQGRAGNVSIKVLNNLQANNGEISTTSIRSSGGTINITAKDIRLYGNSDISTSSILSDASSGNIILTANSIIAFDDSDILAFSRDGRGGNIALNTLAFFGSGYQAARRSTSQQTLDGNNRVDVNATGAISSGNIFIPDTSYIQNNLSELLQTPIDTNALIANSCIARSGNKSEGTFTITGTGGLPNRPGDAGVSSYPTGDVRNVQTENASRPWQKEDPIVEPLGVYRLSSGQLVLSRECL
ncbi:filamentous hemagglutinin N-terminal domain-containing protein [Scytonema sp. UIC 10036]|uniref:two-partner secretion domain-containing protein n=1 Tax=Scytonema sp. UIC 10036 TaxID=2304196 RepID=UPI0012DA9DC8|nr:S-layer family protein [Scytonema sp. UIC 10036]MUG91296.1 filamentous hemagglutinin N-terminal domain-containing protein [Scytonema sp. UIC 10036]